MKNLTVEPGREENRQMFGVNKLKLLWIESAGIGVRYVEGNQGPMYLTT